MRTRGPVCELMILDGDHVPLGLTEGLWDCEPAVRRIAAEHVPLEPAVVSRPAEPAADPTEAGPVRAAARLRAA
ncbi:hypothetical protein [Paractinoplanes brasiliensis]|uniref:hypothetical protein n=1 Tax=Paractinoplanes brasiliensis TaxID=52695 RepID=UPI001061C5D4|nr:hypothetical protein [Actinoplanes brasiliensis]